MEKEFQMASVFSDGAVLQRRKPVRVFGTGVDGSIVRVWIGEENAGTAAGGEAAEGSAGARAVVEDGCWRVTLPPMEAAEGLVLTARCGECVLTARDIAVGEVWIAGGQSNMEFWLRNDAEREEVIPRACDPLLRFFDMPRISYEGQERELSFEEYGRWRSFTPKEAGWFSAVGAYFGMDLRLALDVPVAVVGCNCGATSASCWLGEEYLDQIPVLNYYRESYEQTVEKLDPEKYAKDFRERQAMGMTPKMQEIDRRMARGEIPAQELQKLMADLTPRQLELLSLPAGPMAATRPFALYHSMVEKLAPYTARGVIWYQGEADEVLPDHYAALFGQVVRCWRDTWGEELPFLTVQLAPFGRWLTNTGDAFPKLRSQQQIAADTIPGVWMTCIMDAGMEQDIHPKNKRPVGERLALLARGKVYGEEKLLCEPPRFREGSLEGDTLTLYFDHTGEGLRCASEFPAGLEILAGLESAQCTARVERDRIILQSSAFKTVSQAEARYAQLPYLKSDLFSSAGIPAEPFTAKITIKHK